MLSIKKIIVISVLLVSSFGVAFSQGYAERRPVDTDTIIYVAPEQLEAGVRSVVQAILNKRRLEKNNTQYNILTPENIQLLKYQMLITALGMGNSNRSEVVSSKTDNSNINRRLDRIETAIYSLLGGRKGSVGVHINNNLSDSLSTTASAVDHSELRDIVSELRTETEELKNENPTGVVYSYSTDTITKTVPANFKRQVFFVLGGDILTKDAVETLDEVVYTMNKYPNIVLDVIGYASKDGRYSSNLKLSARRTDKVLNYLVSKGIDSKRLFVQNGGVDSDSSILSTARRVDIFMHK